MKRKTIHLAKPAAGFAPRHGVLSSAAACGTEQMPDARLTLDLAAVTCQRCLRSPRARVLRAIEQRGEER